MSIERPDLTGIDPKIIEYIEYLEAQVDKKRSSRIVEEEPELPLVPSEPPTTVQIITMTSGGIAKRTPRHLYLRQRRAGMGIFDLDTGEKQPPAILLAAEAGQNLLLFTNRGRAFRLPMEQIPEDAIRARGQMVTGRLGLDETEEITAVLPDRARGSVAMLSERGMIRVLRHHVFGEYMKQGTVVFDTRTFGPLVSCCWTPGDGDLFIASQQGHAIRFSEKLVPVQGGPGIRLETGDRGAAVTAVYPDSLVFLLSADGRGILRTMEGFNPNKSAGGSGKIALTTSALAGAFTTGIDDDIFIISRLSKIIRFMAAEVPVKEGVVQGVNCISMRADQVAAAAPSAVP